VKILDKRQQIKINIKNGTTSDTTNELIDLIILYDGFVRAINYNEPFYANNVYINANTFITGFKKFLKLYVDDDHRIVQGKNVTLEEINTFENENGFEADAVCIAIRERIGTLNVK
jgi:hypothetical protein